MQSQSPDRALLLVGGRAIFSRVECRSETCCVAADVACARAFAIRRDVITAPNSWGWGAAGRANRFSQHKGWVRHLQMYVQRDVHFLIPYHGLIDQ